MKARLWALALLVLPLMLLAPHWDEYAYPFQGSYSDLTISHAPNLLFLKNALQRTGEVPLWSDTILSGYPFAANPLSGLWYPPIWLIVPLPSPLGFNLLVWLHLLWGGLGLYLYLRSLGIERLPAALGGISFEMMPKLMGHFASGHVTLIMAVTWTPWLLLAERKRQTGDLKLRFLPGLTLGMVALADVRWAALCGLLWLAYSLHEWAGNRAGKFLLGWAGATLAQTGLALLIAAPLLLPLLEYTRLSTRQFMSGADQLTFSLPPLRLFGLLFPDMGGNAEFLLYPGALGLLMLVWVALRPGLNRKYAFWVGVTLAAVVYALGLPWLTGLPGLNLLRVPARALFLSGLGFAVLLAAGAQDLASRPTADQPKRRFGPGMALVGISVFAALFAVGASALTRQVLIAFLWGAAALLAFTALVMLRQAGKIAPAIFLAALFPLLALDLGGVDTSLFTFRSASDVSDENRAVAAYLAGNPDIFRTYSPSYSLHPLAAVSYGLPLTDGVDPLQLFDYTKFMEKATGIPAEGYSVTLPPFHSADLAHEYASTEPDARLLGLLNVKYLLAEFDVEAPDWTLMKQVGETRIYENSLNMGRAWMQNAQAEPGVGARPIASVSSLPNFIELNAEGPGRLVLSELDYPGWQAAVDGHKVPIIKTAGLLRSVDLGPGQHTVAFRFRPWTVYAGMGLAGLAWLVIFVMTFRGRRAW